MHVMLSRAAASFNASGAVLVSRAVRREVAADCHRCLPSRHRLRGGLRAWRVSPGPDRPVGSGFDLRRRCVLPPSRCGRLSARVKVARPLAGVLSVIGIAHPPGLSFAFQQLRLPALHQRLECPPQHWHGQFIELCLSGPDRGASQIHPDEEATREMETAKRQRARPTCGVCQIPIRDLPERHDAPCQPIRDHPVIYQTAPFLWSPPAEQIRRGLLGRIGNYLSCALASTRQGGQTVFEHGGDDRSDGRRLKTASLSVPVEQETHD